MIASVTSLPACPFCARIEKGEVVLGNDLAAAIPDGFPVSAGHTLVVSRRHVADYFQLSAEEQGAIWALVPEVKVRLDEEHHPSGYNVGMNVGSAAGQTVWHAHVHVIPRYQGDVEDPRGGVRSVIRGKARYWKEAG